ncbi:putative odorant receptor 92a isoform X3 [Temnothorax longispinosus]|uniref:putative odorant receptor 92a isoform X3 n=1 Tax=Temnothorax longispinosus TaxID=300112 RepID=UPI003A99C773
MQSAVKHYYNVNKILMSKLGTWPAQSIFAKIVLPTITTAFIFSIGFLEFVRLSEIWKKLIEDCESCIIAMLTVVCYIKLFVLVLKNKNIERLLSLIDYHWRVFTHSLEVQIMHEYAVIARKMTISYAVTPQLLDLLMPLNQSRPRKYLYDVDFSFDREEYYFSVLLYSYLLTVVDMTVLVVTDTSYLILAHHVCGLFAAIGYRLESLSSTISLNHHVQDAKVACNKYESTNYDGEIYRELILLLRKHQLSLEYVDLLESLFQLYSFSMIFLHFIITSLLGMQIVALMDRKGEMLRYVSFIIGCFVHLLVLNYPGQEIMDHSADIFHKAYNILWYRMPRRTTQLLSILLHRSLVPCKLTAGKLCVLSFQNYASVLQGTLSYFTALLSMR